MISVYKVTNIKPHASSQILSEVSAYSVVLSKVKFKKFSYLFCDHLTQNLEDKSQVFESQKNVNYVI